MGASRLAIFFRVLLPATLPMIFTVIRIALPVALIITIVTEIIGESQGLAYFVMLPQRLMNMPETSQCSC